MAVNFDLLKNTFRPAEPSYLNLKIGQLEPLNQEELANLAEFIRMIGTSTKFAMKAHYELSGKNSSVTKSILNKEYKPYGDKLDFPTIGLEHQETLNQSENLDSLSSCEIEESMDYEPIEEEDFISFDEGWIESDEPMAFEEWLFDQDLHLDIKPDSIEFQALEDLFNSIQHIEEIMQEEIDSHQTEMEYSECSYYPEYERVTKALYTMVENIRKS